ncbi:dTDP-4-dehydrorhamnose 3,5-epimerase [Agrobacterium cavarae]|uniref:dTDP-4-dehydrorhamnose 3,5-epimerase n=1 Tax=Agrobacterium cavarae TaxID=2528239 RepID=UPI003FD48D58
MRVECTSIEGIRKITPTRFEDARGFFSETFKDQWFRRHVEDIAFVQENESLSILKGTLRGLHFQRPPLAQGKLIRCVRGSIWDVIVDLRRGRPSYGEWRSFELSEENGVQLWVPPGFAHGFLTMEPQSLISYKVTEIYSKAHDMGITWDDEDIGITWPVPSDGVVMSEKDRLLPRMAELPNYFSEL